MPSAAGRTKATSSPRVLEEEEDDEEVEDDDGRRKDSGEGAAGPSSKKRAPNFTSVEDAVIARCWKNMTNDAKTGTDQTSDVFWQRLFLKFTTVMMEEKKRTKVLVEGHRTWKTLRSRWRRSIQKDEFGGKYTKGPQIICVQRMLLAHIAVLRRKESFIRYEGILPFESLV